MALSDPFSQTYQGSMQAGMSLGQGINSAAGDVAGAMKQKNQQKQALDLLKQFGMVETKTEEPSFEELETGAREFAKQQGSELNINYGNNKEEAKKNIVGIYKALGIPMPKGKTTTTLNLTPGTEYDPMKGEVSIKNPKSILSGLGLESSAPEGFEVTGYDQKGQPMIRKIKRDVGAEKLDLEKAEKEEIGKVKRQAAIETADDTLNTISEIEKDMDFFGIRGVIPAVPGTSKVNWDANVSKLTAQQLLDKIGEMKSQSATGATGFGQLAVKEFERLADAATALKKGLPKEDAQRYLNEIKNGMQKIKGALAERESSNGSEGEDFSTMSDDELRRIAGGK